MIFGQEQRPKSVYSRTFVASIVIHALFLSAIILLGKINFTKKDNLIPIDLVVVVNQNLDGVENEPPPLQDPPEYPEPPPPKVTPPVKPPEIPDVKDVPAVIKEKPQKPQKTKEQLMKERMERIRKDVKQRKKEQPKKDEKKVDPEKRIRDSLKPTNKKVDIKVDAPSGNGRTDRKIHSKAEIEKLFGMGYKPGTKNQLSKNEAQRCISLIYQAFYSKWQRPAWNDRLKVMSLEIGLGLGGTITSYRLVGSSGDAAADRSVLKAASQVRSVLGLSAEFIRQHRSDIVIRFEVTPQ